MKNVRQLGQLLGMQLTLMLAVSLHAAPETTKPAEEPAEESSAFKSVFQDDLKTGKDPFYPKSTRRTLTVPSNTEPLLSPIVQLSLKGISGPAHRRIALINNKTFTAGETAPVRIDSGTVNVRCWVITENSAVVSVEGDPERKELRLRDSL